MPGELIFPSGVSSYPREPGITMSFRQDQDSQNTKKGNLVIVRPESDLDTSQKYSVKMYFFIAFFKKSGLLQCRIFLQSELTTKLETTNFNNYKLQRMQYIQIIISKSYSTSPRCVMEDSTIKMWSKTF